jgi:raffinose/stachyose/melibiose transport system permease protein
MNQKYSFKFLYHLAAIAVSLVMFIPVYIVVVNSLKTRGAARLMSIGLPEALQWQNFAEVIERGNIAISFSNSMLYAGTSAIASTIIAAMAAFVMSRNKSDLNRFLYFFFIMGIAMPANYFTLTYIMQLTGLINTQIGIILLYIAGQIPFNIFLIYGFVQSLPTELDEAAIIDGAGPIALFSRVIFPLLMPVLVTTGILSFIGVWNDFINPIYFLNDSSKWPMPLAVYNFFGLFEADWNLISADIVLTILPVIIVYIIGQRYIISGMTTGSVKG